MPFTFKPEIAQPVEGQSAPAVSSFGNSQQQSTPTVAQRTIGQEKSLVHTILFALCGFTIFVAVAMFGYHYYLTSQIESKKATLASYESQLGSLPLADMRALSNRIKIINQLVRQHPSTNVAFKIVEDSVENQVTYKSFSLRYADTAKSYALDLSGTAPNYKTVAQQIDTLNRKPYSNYIQHVTLDGLSPDETGKIAFSTRMNIAIIGLLPEQLNLSDGAASLLASTTPEMSTPEVSSSTKATATTTP